MIEGCWQNYAPIDRGVRVKFRFLILFAVVGAVTLVRGGQAQVAYKNSPEIASPAGYSHAVIVSGGKMIFLAGQVGLDKSGQMVGKDDFRAQSMQAFVNLKAALAAVGATSERHCEIELLCHRFGSREAWRVT